MTVVSVERDLEGLRLVIVAEFDAKIGEVWQLWADPRRLERWWGPPDYPATFEHHDLTRGGEARYFMTGPNGARNCGWWRVDHVDAPRTLRFTDGFGTPESDAPTTHVTVSLTAHENTTRMELAFCFGTRERMDQLEHLGAFHVFPRSVGQMDALLRTLIPAGALPGSDAARVFHGHEHGAGVSLFLIESATGEGPALHRHPYPEVFAVREGRVRFVLDGTTIDAVGGDVVIARAGSTHRFTNLGPGRLSLTSIHPVAEMETEWLEDPDPPQGDTP